MEIDLYEAVKIWNWTVIRRYLKNGVDINASLVSTGPQRGYTVLHFAAMKSDEHHVKKLLQYGANVNSVGQDSAQPIHLACLFKKEKIADVLMSAGADPDGELTKELVDKYTKGEKWSDEFNKMPLLAFAVINIQYNVIKLLLDYGANYQIKSINNKSLLMYAIDVCDFMLDTRIIEMLISKMGNCPDLINARDDRNWHAFHFIFLRKQFDKVLFGHHIITLVDVSNIVKKLVYAGADVNVTINGDPSTLLVHMAASRCFKDVLEKLWRVDVPLNDKWKALYYAMLSADIKKFMTINGDSTLMMINNDRTRTVRFILENYSLRREFGLFVPDEETELMDQLVAKYKKMKNIVSNFKIKFIDLLKKKLINKSLVFYDVVVQVLDDEKLKVLVKDENVVKAIENFCTKYPDINCDFFSFCQVILEKVKIAHGRRKLLERVEKIDSLRTVIPLPYEIVLMIIKFVNNESLEKFIEAFYRKV